VSTIRLKAKAGFGRPFVTAVEDAWERRATSVAIEAARKVIGGGIIPAGTPIGRLGNAEWGWIVAAILFGWISTRAEQAVAEEIDTELAVRMTGLDPEPWDAGVVASILPELVEISNVDWTLPLGQLPREAVIDFLMKATRLIRKAEIARDLSSRWVTQKSAGAVAREANAAAGGPLMTPDEFNDDIGI